MLPTPQQRAVLDAVRDRPENLAVSAVAGSGKTTTVVGACKVAGDRVGFAAFNKHIADELKSKLAGRADAVTLHGLGFRTLARSRPGVEVDERKTRRHVESLFPHLHREGKGRWAGKKFLRDEWRGIYDAVSVCRQRNVLPAEDPQGTLAACYRQDVELPDGDAHADFFRYTQEALESMLGDFAAADFDDMIYMPVRLGLVKQEYKTLFVDEAQDLNPAQQQLALGSGDRLAIVGDPRQAIMGFAGADVRSFPALCDRLRGADRGLVELPLSCCFRCPESHLRLARLLVPRIEAGAFADEGVLSERTPEQLIAGVMPPDMVLCRNTAPLVALAYQLIARQVPVLVRGRKIGDGMSALIKQLRPDDPVQLVARLGRWETDQLEKLEADDAPDEAREQVRDRAASLRALATQTETLGELSDLIARLFSDDRPGGKVLLSTVHRAKGLEAARVWVYEPGLMPARAGDPQELNLLYVALTRAKESLFLVDDRCRRRHGAFAWVEGVAAGESRLDLTEKPL